jgi:zinc transporter ZupT
MSFAHQTLLLAVCMALFSVLPLLSATVRRHSRDLFLIGTGALFGICFFDLVPDVFELGGGSSLVIVGAVWLLYSVIHLFHLQHHHHPDQGAAHAKAHHEEPHEHDPEAMQHHGFSLFFGSLVAHCLASGMLLTVSQSFSERIAHTVFLALLAHKTYESLLLSSILVEQHRSRAQQAGLIAVYSLALPVGAYLTQLFQEDVTQKVAVVISSIAVGTLLGCLIFDFLLPSIRQLRGQRLALPRAGWILFGLGLTRIVMAQL